MAENNTLLDKVLGLQDKYNSLQEQLSDPAVISDMKKYVQLNKEYKELAPIIKAGQEYKMMMDEYASAKEIIANEKDEELREMKASPDSCGPSGQQECHCGDTRRYRR